MSLLKEIPPTAGFPIYFKDILSLLSKGSGDFEEDFKMYLSVDYAKATCSGTSAFYLILETLKEISNKRTVIIPSYICPLVPLAIQRAGLKAQICDINTEDFNYNTQELQNICAQNKDIAAVLAAHLGGLPLELNQIISIAKENEILIIEDCAQSLGASYHGKKTGAYGDFSFFSFCRGKGLTIYEGGMFVSNRKEFSVIADKVIARMQKDNPPQEFLKIFEIFGYWIFYRPLLFWYVFSLPKFFWNILGQKHRANIEYFTSDFPVHNVSKTRQKIGGNQLFRLESEIEKQRQKVQFYIEGLKGLPGIRIINELPDSKSSWPFLVVIFDDTLKKEETINKLQGLGLGVSEIYALAINEYEYLKEYLPPGNSSAGKSLAIRAITLSTSVFLSDKDLGRVVDCFFRA